MESLKKTVISAAAALAIVFIAALSLFFAACGAKEYTLTFQTDGGTDIPPITAEAGETIVPPADPVKDGYNFGGWYLDEQKSGESVQIPTVMPEENVTYYAKWVQKTTPSQPDSPTPPDEPGPEEQGTLYSDIFGGADVLKVLDDKIYLIRRGFDQTEGYFNAQNGYFYFGTEENIVLEGIVSDDGFFYYRDIHGKKFTYDNDANRYIQFTDQNKVVYKNSGIAREKEGTFTLGDFCRDFVITSSDGSEQFTVKINADGATFSRVSQEDTRGLYYYTSSAGAYSFLFLDAYRVDGENTGTAYAYSLTDDGKLVFDFSGPYSRSADYIDQTKYSYTVDTGSGSSAFRLTEAEGEVEGYSVAGTFVTGDNMYGSFPVALETGMPGTDRLVMDGFGRAYIQKGANKLFGSYTQRTYAYRLYTTSGFQWWTDTYATFTYDDGVTPYDGEHDTVYIRIEQAPTFEDAASLFYTKPHMEFFAGESSDLYGVYLDDPYPNLALYYYSDMEALIFTYLDNDVDAGTRVYDLVDDGIYEYNADADEYRFTSIQWNPLFFDYRVTDDSDGEGGYLLEYGTLSIGEDRTLTITGSSKSEQVVLGEYGDVTYSLIDPDDPEQERLEQHGTFTVESVQDTTFFMEIYTLTLDDGQMFMTVREEYQKDGTGGYITDSNGNPVTDPNTRKILLYPEEDFLELRLDPYFGYGGEHDRILICGDTALIRLNATAGVAGELVYVWFSGNIAYDSAAETYTFTVADSSLEGTFDDEIWDSYSEFTFKKGAGVAYYCTKDGATYQVEGGGSLILDGYGTATLTSETEEDKTFGYSFVKLRALSEQFEYKDKIVDVEKLKIIALTEGENTYFYYTENGKTVTYAQNAKQYTYTTADGAGMSIAIGYYMLLLGNEGTLNGAHYDGYAVATDGYVGTYVYTGEHPRLTDAGQTGDEVCVTFPYEATQIDGVHISELDSVNMLLLDNVQVSDDGESTFRINLFIQQFNFEGEFVLENGGRVYCDGYNPAVYTADGRETTGVMMRGNFVGNDFTDDPDGRQIIFYYNMVWLETGYGYDDFYLFDIKEGTQNTLILRPNESGVYKKYYRGGLYTDYFELDGYEGATLKSEDGTVLDEGTYKLVETTDGIRFYLFEGNQSFTFTLTGLDTGFVDENDNAQTEYIYVVREDDKVYVNDDWSALVLDYIGKAYTIDKYGFVTEGDYMSVTDDLIAFQPEDTTLPAGYYDILSGDKFRLNTDDFIIREGVLYAYQGESRVYRLVIPDEVTEIADRVFMNLGGIKDYLDLNNVEIIGDYAFANVYEMYADTVRSDKVKRIGDYAFFSNGRAEISYIGVHNYFFPNAEYIGDYAFYGNNQIRQGSITLGDKIKHIGEYAFAHIANADETCTVYMLGATGTVDISKTAFRNISTHYSSQDCPVTVVLTDTAMETSIKGVFTYGENKRDVKTRVQAKDFDMITGNTYFNFQNNIYYGFEEGTLTIATYDDMSGEWSSETHPYTMNLNNVTVTFGENDKRTYLYGAGKLDIGDAVLMQSGYTQVIPVTETGDGERREVNLTMRFTAVFDGSVKITVDYAVYDDHNSITRNYYNGQLALDYDVYDSVTDETQRFRATVDLRSAQPTANISDPGVTIFSGDTEADSEYKAELVPGLYYYLVLYVKDDGAWKKIRRNPELSEEEVGDDSSIQRITDKSGNHSWQITVAETNGDIHTRTIYTVTISGVTTSNGAEDYSNAKISVTTQVLYVRFVYGDGTNYRAVFTSPEQDFSRDIELSQLASWDEGSSSYVDIYNPGQQFMTEYRKEGNNFIVEAQHTNGLSVYTVTFTPDGNNGGTVSVSVNTCDAVEVQTVPGAEHETYYTVVVLFNSDGTYHGLPTGYDFRISSWNEQNGAYTNFPELLMGVTLRSHTGNAYVYDCHTGVVGEDNYKEYTITVTCTNRDDVTVTVVPK